MRLPQLQAETRGTHGVYKYTSRETIDAFKGYARHRRIPEGSFFDTAGVCGDEYPIVSRLPEIVASTSGVPSPTAIAASGGDLAFVTNHTAFYSTDGANGVTIKGYPIPAPSYGLSANPSFYIKVINASTGLTVSDVYPGNCLNKFGYRNTDVLLRYTKNPAHQDVLGWYDETNGQWLEPLNVASVSGAVEGSTFTIRIRLAHENIYRMGSYWIIMPQKQIYDSATGTLRDMELTQSIASTSPVALNSDLETIDNSTQSTPPAEGEYRVNYTTDPITQEQYLNGEWVAVPFCTKIPVSASEIAQWAVGDNINVTWTVGGVSRTSDGTIIAVDTTNNYIIAKGIIYETGTSVSSPVLKRVCPDMDYCVVHDNRLWGCSYSKHEIYACELGNPFAWTTFEGIASDSYTATYFPEGPYTGAAEISNYIVFFTETSIVKIYGTQPSNFTISEQKGVGVEKYSADSIVNIENVLYYLAADGIYRFNGSSTVKVTDALGTGTHTNGAGAAANRKYYLNVYGEGSFCLDLNTGTFYKLAEWHEGYPTHGEGKMFRSDILQNYCGLAGDADTVYWFAFAALSESTAVCWLCAMDYDRARPLGFAVWGKVSFGWYLETGDIGLSLPDQKYVSRLVIRVDLAQGATFTVSASYDGSAYTEEATITGTGVLTTYNVPIIPHRCDHMRLKFEGSGEMYLYSINKQIEQGSELL